MLFWPRHHIDPDFGYTILTPLDSGGGLRGGGDFAFGAIGWVLKCEDGDVLVFNGMHLHATTEFDVVSGSDGRLFFAFYLKGAALEGAIRNHVLQQRIGSQPLNVVV